MYFLCKLVTLNGITIHVRMKPHLPRLTSVDSVSVRQPSVKQCCIPRRVGSHYPSTLRQVHFSLRRRFTCVSNKMDTSLNAYWMYVQASVVFHMHVWFCGLTSFCHSWSNCNTVFVRAPTSKHNNLVHYRACTCLIHLRSNLFWTDLRHCRLGNIAVPFYNLCVKSVALHRQ
jgi:hypothetical protein